MDDYLTTLSRRVVLAPLDDTGRTHEVISRIRTAILVGIFADGERLPNEASLAQKLAVSPVTLREAIRVLREEALVRTVRGRSGGTFVTTSATNATTFLRKLLLDKSPIALRDLVDLQTALLSHAARLAAERATVREISSLSKSVDSMYGGTDAVTLRRTFSRFLIVVAAASRSGSLSKSSIELQVEWAPLVTLIFDDESAKQTVTDGMAETVKSIQSRDSVESFERMYHLLETIGERLQSLQFELSQEIASGGDSAQRGLDRGKATQ